MPLGRSPVPFGSNHLFLFVFLSARDIDCDEIHGRPQNIFSFANHEEYHIDGVTATCFLPNPSPRGMVLEKRWTRLGEKKTVSCEEPIMPGTLILNEVPREGAGRKSRNEKRRGRGGSLFCFLGAVRRMPVGAQTVGKEKENRA